MPLEYPVAILTKTTNVFKNSGANHIELTIQAGNASYDGILKLFGSTGVGLTLSGDNSTGIITYTTGDFQITPDNTDSARGQLVLGDGACFLTSGNYNSGNTNNLTVQSGDSEFLSGNLILKSGSSFDTTGNTTVSTGASSMNLSGTLTLSTGAAANSAGPIYITSGSSTAGAGGDINIATGASDVGATYNGGNINLTCGAGDLAGHIVLTAGESFSGTGGDVTLNGGQGVNGGNVYINAGAQTGGTAGSIQLISPQGGTLSVTDKIICNGLDLSGQTITFSTGTYTVTFPSVSDTVAVLGTAQTFTANQRINNNLGFSTATFGTQNRLLVNAYNVVNNSAIVQFSSTNATYIPLVLQGFTSQSGNLLELQNNSGTMLARFKSDATLEVAGGAGTTSTASIKIINSSSFNPIIQWNTVGANTGLRFYSNTTEVARIQDNGAFMATSIETLGTMRLYNYGIQRGNSSQKLDLGDAGQPAFDFNTGSSSFSDYVRVVSPQSTYPAHNITTVTTNDDPNHKTKQNRVTTTDATVTTLETLAITASKTYLIEARVIARRTGGSAGTADDGAAYVRRSLVTTKGGTVTINAVDTEFTQEDQAGWDCTLTVSGANILVRVTGATDNNVTWHSTCIYADVGS